MIYATTLIYVFFFTLLLILGIFRNMFMMLKFIIYYNDDNDIIAGGSVIISGTATRQNPIEQINREDINIDMVDFIVIDDEEMGRQRDTLCVICLDNMEINTSKYRLLCGHEYHIHCLNKWFKTNQNNRQCPICKQYIDSY